MHATNIKPGLCSMEVPDDVQRIFPSWLYPTGQTRFTQQSRPDGVIVLPLEDRDTTRFPRLISPRELYLPYWTNILLKNT
eukprot:559746-Pelagomonas_calceolata.AAC.2